MRINLNVVFWILFLGQSGFATPFPVGKSCEDQTTATNQIAIANVTPVNNGLDISIVAQALGGIMPEFAVVLVSSAIESLQ